MIRPCTKHDLAAVTHLLAAADLGHDDLAAHLSRLVVAEADGAVVGAGGFEDCGEGIALLRSFVVQPEHRGRGVGRELVQRVMTQALAAGLHDFYLLTTTAQGWFATLGFAPAARDTAPPGIRATRQFSALCPATAVLMCRRLDAGDVARLHFQQGLYCAESVLTAVARQCGVESPLIPAIATGLCSGMARTGGPCGALTGGILAINIASGRQHAGTSVERNYRLVQRLIGAFEAAHGATRCDALLGCHLGTPEGQRSFNEQGLHTRCLEYTGSAARLAAALIDEDT